MDSQTIIPIILLLVLVIAHYIQLAAIEVEKINLKIERDFYREKYLEKP